jgi:5-methylcytosine-specific restriction endonuclease McrA
MPANFSKPCAHPGCHATVASGRYCANHADKERQRGRLYDQVARRADPTLALAAKIRGGARWRKVRGIKIARNPLCEDPFAIHENKGHTVIAREVHHIQPLASAPEMAYTMTNLMSLCSQCHRKLELQTTRPKGGGVKSP